MHLLWQKFSAKYIAWFFAAIFPYLSFILRQNKRKYIHKMNDFRLLPPTFLILIALTLANLQLTCHFTIFSKKDASSIPMMHPYLSF